MMTTQPDDGTLASLLGVHENVVLVDEDSPGVSVPRIFVENERGAWLATRHLIAAGHRDVALIGGPEGLLSVRERLAGFTRAMVTIADSQLTTLVAAFIMFWLGSGPIRGFAVTLTIGIFTSVFTAVTVTRLLVALWLQRARGRTRAVDVPI